MAGVAVAAKDLHRQAKRVLGSIYQDYGYGRLKGTSTAAWSKPCGPEFVVSWLQPSRSGDRFGWYGTSFVIEFRRGKDESIGVAGPSFRLAKLLDDDGRERVRGVQNAVIRKMPPPPDAALAALADQGEAGRHWYLSQADLVTAPYSPKEDIWFRHRDQEDLDRWWGLLTELLPHALAAAAARLCRPT